MIKAELVKPAAAMNEDDNGIRPGGFPANAIRELQITAAIAVAMVGNIPAACLNLMPRNIHPCGLRHRCLP